MVVACIYLLCNEETYHRLSHILHAKLAAAARSHPQSISKFGFYDLLNTLSCPFLVLLSDLIFMPSVLSRTSTNPFLYAFLFPVSSHPLSCDYFTTPLPGVNNPPGSIEIRPFIDSDIGVRRNEAEWLALTRRISNIHHHPEEKGEKNWCRLYRSTRELHKEPPAWGGDEGRCYRPHVVLRVVEDLPGVPVSVAEEHAPDGGLVSVRNIYL